MLKLSGDARFISRAHKVAQNVSQAQHNAIRAVMTNCNIVIKPAKEELSIHEPVKQGTSLIAMDVLALYTSIPNDDGIAATASVLNITNCQFPDAILLSYKWKHLLQSTLSRPLVFCEFQSDATPSSEITAQRVRDDVDCGERGVAVVVRADDRRRGLDRGRALRADVRRKPRKMAAAGGGERESGEKSPLLPGGETPGLGPEAVARPGAGMGA
eukprot:g41605.t1